MGLSRYFKSHRPDLAEIHQYTLDLERITMLRDKARSSTERERYTTIIEVMQEVLQFINHIPHKQ